jgi:hypothetical protein
MALTAKQHSQLAAVYELAAADFLLPPQKRAEFAEKAEWFRTLAQHDAFVRERESFIRNVDALSF